MEAWNLTTWNLTTIYIQTVYTHYIAQSSNSTTRHTLYTFALQHNQRKSCISNGNLIVILGCHLMQIQG